mmetsp:Transcript_89424/g.177778  ORF Transcript_89424/g.177778 Transcript_89424/m.177778 type:complete len:108 (-) Transcript_89424:84-407(-)
MPREATRSEVMRRRCGYLQLLQSRVAAREEEPNILLFYSSLIPLHEYCACEHALATCIYAYLHRATSSRLQMLDLLPGRLVGARWEISRLLLLWQRSDSAWLQFEFI